MKTISLTAAALFLAANAILAQQTYFEVRLENIGTAYQHLTSGAFAVPDGATEPAPIGPGGSYSFDFDAAPGHYLSFLTMFVPSNDLFFAPPGLGIPLYDADGVPASGDITDQLSLWDAGTEMNQEPGVGSDQPQRQQAANTGETDPDNTVRMVNDGFDYPEVGEVISVVLTHNGGTSFSVTLSNVSTGETLKPSDGTMQPVPLSPGVFVVHSDPAPLFTAGVPDAGVGLESVAEDGNPESLTTALEAVSGVTQILAPVAWAVHSEAGPFFSEGQPAGNDGLETLAEDGGPLGLAASLHLHETSTGGAQVLPVGADAPGPIGPGGAYEFTIAGRPGSSLTLSSMVVQSNDLFVAPDESGVALWDADGPIEGDITSRFMIWDAGTEINEAPGVGPNQAPRQAGPDTGPDEDGVVSPVADGFSYPEVTSFARVTIRPIETMPFRIRIENVSTDQTLKPSDGSEQAVPLAPAVWVVHTNRAPLFAPESVDRGLGLEALAEDGGPSDLADALAMKLGYASGAVAIPEGAAGPAPIGPGQAYVFTVDAAPGSYLSLATMFVPSNDLFFGPDERGIALFDNGVARTGDVTGEIALWDAGTEVNQEPGVGPDQPQRQAGPNSGAEDPHGMVRIVNDGFTYPDAQEVIMITIESVTTSTEVGESLPEGFQLDQNYPNPFNPTTRIFFALREATQVELVVYDVLGKRIASLVDGFLQPGRHSAVWNGRRSDGEQAATGTYLYRVEVGNGSSQTRKMLLLR